VSRVFSFSSSLRRWASATVMPPNCSSDRTPFP
jgi:hypothetical protein